MFVSIKIFDANMSRFTETCQAFGLSKERTALAWDDLLKAGGGEDDIQITVSVALKQSLLQVGDEISGKCADAVGEAGQEARQILDRTDAAAKVVFKQVSERLAEQKKNVVNEVSKEIAKTLAKSSDCAVEEFKDMLCEARRQIIDTADEHYRTHVRHIRFRELLTTGFAMTLSIVLTVCATTYIVRQADDDRVDAAASQHWNVPMTQGDSEIWSRLITFNPRISDAYEFFCHVGSERIEQTGGRLFCDLPVWLEPSKRPNPGPSSASSNLSFLVGIVGIFSGLNRFVYFGIGFVIGLVISRFVFIKSECDES